MSFIASLDSSSLLPKILSSLNIRTWRKWQVSSCVSSSHKWLTSWPLAATIDDVLKHLGLSAQTLGSKFWCLPAGKDRLCLTRRAPESNQTWLSSSGFSPTVGPARKNKQKKKTKAGNKTNMAHLSIPFWFIRCSFLFMMTFSKIKVINFPISGSHIQMTNIVVPTFQWLKINISEVVELKHWSQYKIYIYKKHLDLNITTLEYWFERNITYNLRFFSYTHLCPWKQVLSNFKWILQSFSVLPRSS